MWGTPEGGGGGKDVCNRGTLTAPVAKSHCCAFTSAAPWRSLPSACSTFFTGVHATCSVRLSPLRQHRALFHWGCLVAVSPIHLCGLLFAPGEGAATRRLAHRPKLETQGAGDTFF